MAKRRKSAAEALQRWQAGVAAGGQAYTQGIQAATNWAESAVAAGPARDAALQQAISDGRINAGIQRVGTAGWKAKTLAKGPGSWNASVNSAAGAQSYAQGFARLSNFLQAGDQAVANMPRGSFATNLQRMNAYVSAVHQASQAYKQQNG